MIYRNVILYHANTPDHTGVAYPLSVLEQISNGNLIVYGTVSDPFDNSMKTYKEFPMEEASHKIFKLRIEQDCLVGHVKILPKLPKGAILKEKCEQVGFCSVRPIILGQNMKRAELPDMEDFHLQRIDLEHVWN